VSERTRLWLATLVVVAALTVVLAGQSLADRAAPEVPNGVVTGQVMGRAGFAYLTGLRVFVADLLWNRLDPLMDTYYRAHYGLGHMTFMLPSVEVITMLDPQLIDAYYVAPEILIENGRLPGSSPQEAKARLQTALELAKEGVINNPKSGLLLQSYAQLLWTYGKDLKAALPYAERAMQKGVVWRTDEEEWDSMAILADIFKKAGMPEQAAAAQAVKTEIDNNPNATMDQPG
jgi:hypothetical protein